MTGLPLTAARAFAAVFTHGGVRPAARALGIAHSAVSRQVARLEAWLGCSLIDTRHGRGGLRFTAQGAALGRAAAIGFESIHSTVESLREARASNGVVLSAAPSFAARWLLPRLRQFQHDHPSIELSVMVSVSLDDVVLGRADLAVRMGRGPWPDVTAEALMDDVVYPVMAPRYWKEQSRPSSPRALAKLRLIHDRDPGTTWEIWRAVHGPAGLDVRRGQRFTSSDLVLQAAAEGLGVALARQRLAASDIAAGRLVRPFAQLEVKTGTAYWVVLSNRARQRAVVQAVRDWLHVMAADRPGESRD